MSGPLEIVYNQIRAGLHQNNNPTVKQFQGMYNRLSYGAMLKSGVGCNIVWSYEKLLPIDVGVSVADNVLSSYIDDLKSTRTSEYEMVVLTYISGAVQGKVYI